jgi:hypothetical protein
VVYKKDKTSVMASNSAKVSSDKVAKSKAPFRYRWQKSGRFEYQEALIKADNADSTEDKNKAVRTKESDVMDDDESVRIFNHPYSLKDSSTVPTWIHAHFPDPLRSNLS